MRNHVFTKTLGKMERCMCANYFLGVIVWLVLWVSRRVSKIIQLTNSDTLLYNQCNNTYDRAWIGMREGLIGVSYLSGWLTPFLLK